MSKAKVKHVKIDVMGKENIDLVNGKLQEMLKGSVDADIAKVKKPLVLTQLQKIRDLFITIGQSKIAAKSEDLKEFIKTSTTLNTCIEKFRNIEYSEIKKDEFVNTIMTGCKALVDHKACVVDEKQVAFLSIANIAEIISGASTSSVSSASTSSVSCASTSSASASSVSCASTSSASSASTSSASTSSASSASTSSVSCANSASTSSVIGKLPFTNTHNQAWVCKNLDLDFEPFKFNHFRPRLFWNKVSDKADRSYMLDLLTSVFIYCYQLYDLITQPDSDPSEITSTLLAGIGKLRSRPELARCQGAFAILEKSGERFKKGFGTYYRDMLESGSSSTLTQSFLMDLSKTKMSVIERFQFRKLISFIEEQSKNTQTDSTTRELFKLAQKSLE